MTISEKVGRATVRLALFLLAGMVVVGAYVPTARAHAEVERALPVADSVIPNSPARVEVWFTQELFRREGANRLEVFAPDGSRVDEGDSRIDDDDRKHLLVSLAPDLPAGTYTVRWYTISLEDGHEEQGEFVFTIDPAAPAPTPTSVPSATPAPTVTAPPAAGPTIVAETPAPAPAASPAPPVLAIAGIALVIGIGAFLWWKGRRA